MTESENCVLTPFLSGGGQAMTEYAVIIGLVLVACFFMVGAIGIQVSSLLALVLPAFAT